MVLQNVPQYVDAGTSIEEAMSEVTAVITFEEDVTKTVAASELSFSAIPDMETMGEKTLVAVYNKTFRGENCAVLTDIIRTDPVFSLPDLRRR